MKQIFYLCFACSVLAHGQKSEEYYSYKKKFPNESLIRLLEEVTYRISLENDHIKITQNIKEEDLYLDQTASFNSKRSLTYSSFFDLQSIEAASLPYNGSKYKENLVKKVVKQRFLIRIILKTHDSSMLSTLVTTILSFKIRLLLLLINVLSLTLRNFIQKGKISYLKKRKKGKI